MYEQNNSSTDFFTHNDQCANRITCKIIFIVSVIFPLFLLLSYSGILHISSQSFLLPTLMVVILDAVLLTMLHFKVSSQIIKYYCLIEIEVVIGLMSTNAQLGIYITYVIAPVMSCIYFDKTLTRRISFFGYFMMIIGLVFRANSVVTYELTTMSSLTWLISYTVRFTTEYLLIVLICYSIAVRARKILEDVFMRKQTIDYMQQQMIFSFANIIESRDDITGQHVKRTSAYVRLIAEELKYSGLYSDELNNATLEYICLAAPIHDIGKLRIPDSILCKPGGLTDAEYNIIKSHTVRGREIIDNTMSNIENKDFLKIAKDVAYYHHERWDGTGYPTGISGRDIPLCARIMSVADVFDALVSRRSYKDSYSLDDAFNELIKSSGKQFEPLIVDIFVSRKDVVKQIYRDII